MKAIVLAAGKGVRLWPLTKTRPKPLLPILGTPLLHRTIRTLVESGATEIVLVLNYKAPEIQRSVAEIPKLGVRVSYVKQKSPNGTADAVLAARTKVENDDSFVVVYADNYYAPSAVKRVFESSRNGADSAYIGAVTVPDSSQFGRLTMRKDRVITIREKAPSKGPGTVISGLYVLTSSIFQAIRKTKLSKRREYELTDSLQALIDKQETEVRTFPVRDSEWQSVSYPWDILQANRLELDRMKDSRSGVVEEGARVRGKLVCGKGSLVKSGCYFEGPVFLDENASVGPNAYVRPYTVIGRGAHVGANCEIKNSVLMENSKVPHLSYIGDSILGTGVSLGAGTITANLRFDDAPVWSKVRGEWVDSGRRKLGAVFGDNAKTGINVSILPGVKVGAGAWLGPGAIVTQDVPDGTRLKR